MPDIIQDAPEIEITPQEPAADAPAGGDPGSLTEHIEAFHSDGDAAQVEEPKPDAGAEKKRHRSYKNQARPEDVPRIKALNDKVRELEEKLSSFTAQKPAETPSPQRYVPPAPAQTDGFSETEPVLGDAKYANSADPYSDWQRDLARYDRRKEAWEDKQQHVSAETKQQVEAFERAARARADSYSQKVTQYITEHPERAQAFQSLPRDVNSPLLVETIWSMDDGPDVVYHLRQSHPALFDELVLLTVGKPVSEYAVAATTNWLRTRLQAGSTGAVARGSTPYTPAPRPPTPVRTPPMTPPGGAPKDDDSLMDHQRYFKTAR